MTLRDGDKVLFDIIKLMAVKCIGAACTYWLDQKRSNSHKYLKLAFSNAQGSEWTLGELTQLNNTCFLYWFIYIYIYKISHYYK